MRKKTVSLSMSTPCISVYQYTCFRYKTHENLNVGDEDLVSMFTVANNLDDQHTTHDLFEESKRRTEGRGREQEMQRMARSIK